MDYKLALYSEYIGSVRNASDRRLVAVANTEEEINAIFAKLYTPQLHWRLEDWKTGKTLDTK